jgi:outer membrane receptor protein involved in Fe transport
VYRGSRTDKEWTGTVSLSYVLSDNMNGYLSAGRGYKAGGFNLDRAGLANPLLGQTPAVDDLEFGAETVDSYEAGLKSQLLDNLLTLNLAAFYSEFNDFQLNTFTGINFIVSNVAKATTKGIEADFTAFVNDSLTLAGGVTYSDARYGGGITSPPGSPVPLAGKRLTNAPLWSTNLAATMERPLTGNLNGLLHVDMRFTGNLNSGSDLLPQKQQGGFTVWNARVGVSTADNRWQFELWSRNLFDKNYQQVAFNAPLQGSVASGTQTFNTFLAEPRTWGGTLRINF